MMSFFSTISAPKLKTLALHPSSGIWNGAVRFPANVKTALPWDCKSPQDRVDKLEKQQRDLARKWGPQPNEEDVREMREAYSLLRATLEGIVERVVFADVVFRFRSYIDMKKLKRVVGFPDSECDEYCVCTSVAPT